MGNSSTGSCSDSSLRSRIAVTGKASGASLCFVGGLVEFSVIDRLFEELNQGEGGWRAVGWIESLTVARTMPRSPCEPHHIRLSRPQVPARAWPQRLWIAFNPTHVGSLLEHPTLGFLGQECLEVTRRVANARHLRRHPRRRALAHNVGTRAPRNVGFHGVPCGRRHLLKAPRHLDRLMKEGSGPAPTRSPPDRACGRVDIMTGQGRAAPIRSLAGV